MGVVDAGLTSVAHEAHACGLCAANASAALHPHAPTKRDRRDELVPWAVAITVGVLITSFGVGGDRWLDPGNGSSGHAERPREPPQERRLARPDRPLEREHPFFG